MRDITRRRSRSYINVYSTMFEHRREHNVVDDGIQTYIERAIKKTRITTYKDIPENNTKIKRKTEIQFSRANKE